MAPVRDRGCFAAFGAAVEADADGDDPVDEDDERRGAREGDPGGRKDGGGGGSGENGAKFHDRSIVADCEGP